MTRTIVQFGDAILRKTARALTPEEATSDAIQKLINDMKKLLAKEDLGVALAAPQVGEPLRLFIVSGRVFMDRDEKGDPIGAVKPDLVFINPEIIRASRGKKPMHEGCLSLKGKWGMVPRAEKISLHALDEHGKEFTRNASGLLAHIFQHEMDHLEGILYTDKAKEVYDDNEEVRR